MKKRSQFITTFACILTIVSIFLVARAQQPDANEILEAIGIKGGLLVSDQSFVYGYGHKPEFLCDASVLEYHLYAADKAIKGESINRVAKAPRRINVKSNKRNADSSDWKLRQGFSRDELSAANGRLYLVSNDGKVICFWSE